MTMATAITFRPPAMLEFFQALTRPEFGFLRQACALGVVAAPLVGMLGAVVVVRRLTYLAAALAHAVLGGIGVALYLERALGWTWVDPRLGALLAGLAAALLLALVTQRGGEREDTVISALWTLGMATGFLFLAHTPGYVEPSSYLFGNLLLVGRADVIGAGILSLLALVLGVFFFRPVMTVCFDPEYARVRGMPVFWVNLALLVAVALAVVFLVTLAGVILVIALLTLPAATALRVVSRASFGFAGAALMAMLTLQVGLALSFILDLPTGPLIIVLAGGCYFLAVALTRNRVA